MIADPTTDDRLYRAFAALSDPVRRRIIARLSRGQATVNELADLCRRLERRIVGRHSG